VGHGKGMSNHQYRPDKARVILDVSSEADLGPKRDPRWDIVTIFAFSPRLIRLSHRRPHVPQSRGHLLLSFPFSSSNISRTYLILSFLILSFSYHHSKTKAKHVSFEPSIEAVYKSQETPLKNFLLQASSISG